MLLFFTPNPCIERTLSVSDFAAGHSFRALPAQVRVTAGGKGINAARVAQRFGADVISLAPAGKNQIAQLRELTRADGIATDWVEVESDTRTATNIVHRGGHSEVVEAGNPLSVAEGAALCERFAHHLANCELAILGGSYPPAAPGDERAWELHGGMLCSLAARSGRRVIYDGKGAAFARAINSEAPPWAIKPNLSEASEFLGRALETPADERGAVRHFLARGVEVVLLSCGARGLYVGYNRCIEWLSAPLIDEVSPVGSGDSLVGAFAAHYAQSDDVLEAARWGVAAGAANAAQIEAARIGPDDVAPLLRQVKSRVAEIALGEP